MLHRHLIALGANLASSLGDPAQTLRGAIDRIASGGGTIRAVSHFYGTPAFPAGAGPDFVNAAVAVDSDLSPAAMLAVLHGIEAELGRRRRHRWGARTLDLDLLAVGDAVLPDATTFDYWRGLAPERQGAETPDTLILPHPRIADRAFVLVPLNDVAPDWCHPVLGLRVRDMLAALPRAAVGAVRPCNSGL